MENVRLHRQLKYVDLVWVEAKYHSKCRKSFNAAYRNQIRAKKREESKETDPEQTSKSRAQENAFSSVIKFIEKHIVEKNEIVHLSDLCQIYVGQLDADGYPKPDYRSFRLMKRLQNHQISDSIKFNKLDVAERGCTTFFLVHSASITVSGAVSHAYRLTACDHIQDVALNLRCEIIQAFKSSTPLPWPPTYEDIDVSMDKLLPKELMHFLNILLTGKPEIGQTSEKSKRLMVSIGQDICRVVTDGGWKLPKHILLCTTVRHLYCNKQLMMILFRLGHSESYSFALKWNQLCLQPSMKSLPFSLLESSQVRAT